MFEGCRAFNPWLFLIMGVLSPGPEGRADGWFTFGACDDSIFLENRVKAG